MGKRGRVGRGAAVAKKFVVKRVLVVDVGGKSVKILVSGHKVHRSFPSGPKMTPKDMVAGVKKLAADWAYDAVSMVIWARCSTAEWSLSRIILGADGSASISRRHSVVR